MARLAGMTTDEELNKMPKQTKAATPRSGQRGGLNLFNLGLGPRSAKADGRGTGLGRRTQARRRVK